MASAQTIAEAVRLIQQERLHMEAEVEAYLVDMTTAVNRRDWKTFQESVDKAASAAIKADILRLILQKVFSVFI